jgi:hypothetical protein
VSFKENPFVPLIVLISAKNTEPTLLTLGLQFLKALSINSSFLFFFSIIRQTLIQYARIPHSIIHSDHTHTHTLSLLFIHTDYLCKDPQIVARFIQLGGDNIIKRLVELINHENIQIQIATLGFIVLLTSGFLSKPTTHIL